MGRVTARPHDLLRLRASGVDAIAAHAPNWVARSLASVPWVVVRRERDAGGLCVGVRGETRAERYAAVLSPEGVERCVPLERLVACEPPRAHQVFKTLELAYEAARAIGLPCVPAGAAAFELASGAPVLHDRSDLDLVVRASFDDSRLPLFGAALARLPVRVDVEVCAGDAWGASLLEVVAGTRVMVKTPGGPRLIDVR